MQENENSLIIACGDPHWKGERSDEDNSDGERGPVEGQQ